MERRASFSSQKKLTAGMLKDASTTLSPGAFASSCLCSHLLVTSALAHTLLITAEISQVPMQIVQTCNMRAFILSNHLHLPSG